MNIINKHSTCQSVFHRISSFMCYYLVNEHYICLTIITKSNIMQEYINRMIETGLHNGLTLDQMSENLEATHEAFLKSSLAELDQIEARLPKQFNINL